jgi:hypothetical protein
MFWTSNKPAKSKPYIRKCLERGGCGQSKILFRHLPGVTEENHQKSQIRIADNPSEIRYEYLLLQLVQFFQRFMHLLAHEYRYVIFCSLITASLLEPNIPISTFFSKGTILFLPHRENSNVTPAQDYR